MDAQGSRYVQHRMEAAQQEEKQTLIDELLPVVAMLADDGYGNYVVQNFVEHASEHQRAAIAGALRGSVRHLAMRPHGCRVVQRLLELVVAGPRETLLDELLETGKGREVIDETKSREIFVRLAQHPSATHVLQKAVLVLQGAMGTRAAAGEEDPESSDRKGFAERTAAVAAERQISTMEHALAGLNDGELLRLSCHPNAYRLVQKLLWRCERRNKAAARLIDHVMSPTVAAVLATDQHGNFLLQHVLDAGSEKQAAEVQDCVARRARELCRHKFASHLVEKCLTAANATTAQRAAIVRALLCGAPDAAFDGAVLPPAEDDELLCLMRDPYANFVVQRAFDATRGSNAHAELCQAIRARSAELSNFTFGRHILSHMSSGGTSGGHPRRGGRGSGGRGY